MNKHIEQIKHAHSLGYRVENGVVISPYSGRPRKLKIGEDKSGYRRASFNIRATTGEAYPIDVHQLVAYQKYGDDVFNSGIEVRHLDGDSLNNCDENIAIGTCSENAFDKPKEMRVSVAITASTNNRKFSDEEVATIRKFYKNVRSYKLTMEEFNIKSKGTLHYILNTEYKTTK